MEYELCAKYSTRKSFYGKATVKEEEDNICKNYLLYSYGTLVGIYTEDKITGCKIYHYLGHYSATTTTHQKEFFKQNGLTDAEIKKLFKEGILQYGINE